MKSIEWLDGGIARIERLIAIALTAAITLIMMAQVVLRYLFSAPLFWAEEISVQLLVFVTLAGVSLLIREGGLVSVDILPAALSERRRHALFVLLGLVMLPLLVFVAYWGWDWISRSEVRIELGATTQLPRWYNYAALPIAFTAMVVHQFVAVLRHLRAAGGWEGQDEGNAR